MWPGTPLLEYAQADLAFTSETRLASPRLAFGQHSILATNLLIVFSDKRSC
jgi:hypothetical protein